MTDSLDNHILLYLFEITSKGPDRVYFDQLYENLPSFSQEDIKLEINILKDKQLVLPVGTEDWAVGSIMMTAEGKRLGRQLWQKHNNDLQKQHPTTLSALVKKEPIYAPSVCRHEVINTIKDILRGTDVHSTTSIILFGPTMVGKTTMLSLLYKELPKSSTGQYRPFIITCEDLKYSNLSAFVHSLLDNFTKKLGYVGGPDHQTFTPENCVDIFYEYWQKLRMNQHQQWIIMVDEIGHLLENDGKNSREIMEFFLDFIDRPDTGHFILVETENISNPENPFTQNRRRIRLSYYLEDVPEKILSPIVQDYFDHHEDINILKCFKSLCDGQPKILDALYSEVARRINLLGRRKLNKNDIDQISRRVISENQLVLYALWKGLNEKERFVIWLFGKKISAPMASFEGYVHELTDFISHDPEHDLSDDTYDMCKEGLDDLAIREWLVWTPSKEVGVFQFKLGIVPLWVNYHRISYKIEQENGY